MGGARYWTLLRSITAIRRIPEIGSTPLHDAIRLDRLYLVRRNSAILIKDI